MKPFFHKAVLMVGRERVTNLLISTLITMATSLKETLIKLSLEKIIKQSGIYEYELEIIMINTYLCKGTSGLLVKVLACNRKVAGSSPTRYKLFSPMSILSSTLKNEEVFITASFRGLSLFLGSWLLLANCRKKKCVSK